ncbi:MULTISPECIES: DUF4239 domain-containing protein [Actinosynnema]|uniref:bestrophin-like domain n=1 Tax=Actinosynnema TaxID=40566 RepID=UPI0020A27877|nr:DUF4239 domain-containing protein [Actinosynnema pretiosum]MCP2095648.1 Protein of unknown function (DUF4239) [Actinosynnema pretiosum]
MSVYITGFLWVGGAAVAAALLAYLIRRFGADEGRAENNEAAGQVFTIVGGLHAVLVAFVLIALFDGVTSAGDGAFTEADSLVAATWASDALSPDAGAEVRELARHYAMTVADEEWPVMRTGASVDSSGWATLDQMRKVVAAAPTTDDWQVDRKTEATRKLWAVYEARQERLDAASGRVSSVIWFTLALGTALSLAMPLLFGGPLVRTHVVIVSTLAAAMALLLFATYQLQNPFDGGADVGPDAFQAAVERLA